MRHYCLGGCSVPSVCARRWRPVRGGFGPVPGVVSLLFPPSRPACSALRVAGRPVRVSLTLARWYTIPCGLCVPRARFGCPSGSPRVSFSCVCARALAVSAPPPLGGVARASRVVPALGAGRAVPRGPCPSACPAPVPCPVWRAWGGAVRSRFPPTWLWVVGAAAPGRPSSGAGTHGSASRVSRVRSGRAWGLCTGPTACVLAGRRCSLWVWRRGVPGGVPSTAVRGAWCQVLSLPRPPVLWSGQPGFHVPCVRGAVGAGVGTHHRPHSVSPCGPALLAVGVAEGRPRGGCLPPL